MASTSLSRVGRIGAVAEEVTFVNLLIESVREEFHQSAIQWTGRDSCVIRLVEHRSPSRAQCGRYLDRVQNVSVPQKATVHVETLDVVTIPLGEQIVARCSADELSELQEHLEMPEQSIQPFVELGIATEMDITEDRLPSVSSLDVPLTIDVSIDRLEVDFPGLTSSLP